MTPVWSWTAEHDCLVNISGVKKRRHPIYGSVVLLCASGGYCAMVSYPDGKLLWQSISKGNCHSIELLPGGKIATASSHGNVVRLFSTERDFIEAEAEYAHGVLYDPERSSLWTLEKFKLCERDPETLEIKGNVCDFKGKFESGHDLAPFYGDTNLLWVTAHEGTLIYNKRENSLSRVEFIEHANTKGIGNIPDTNTVFTIYPNGTFKSWCTDEIHYYIGKNEHTVRHENAAYYKIRIFDERYQ